MRRYLLIAGDFYYPSDGIGNWIDTFETIEELKKEVIIEKVHPFYQKGKNTENITIRGKRYDWWEIVDLFEWINKKRDEITDDI